MPQSNEPIKKRPKVEDESTGPEPEERKGKHRERDEAHPGRGSTKGGLNRESGVENAGDADRAQPTRAVKQSPD